ncbi:hypothetical protein [Streptomyces sp. NBC_00151]|uniref:hypothetical protein n=1 Tax=Streptomyces sp. NBC_00151 TaxID=2975669 RepID=UPI002DD93F48|nr:hypothetical protein [Streptomyces sp. NBC_00151]WRZ41869.1 hypothetical protein OG915_29820 [Streptomyces sp. NBC_00151]
MTRKQRLSPQQHTDMGRALAAIRDELTHRTTQLANAYPQTGADGFPTRKLRIAARAVDDARSALDSTLFREHPNQAETTTYYPYLEDREASAIAYYPRGSMRATVAATVPCPVCSGDSSYFRELDRYVHRDGSGNSRCWLAIGRGESS